MVLGLSMARLDLLNIAKDATKPDHASLILLAAAPPIASSAGLCFLLGFNARLALETTLIATILTPIIGPLQTH